MRLFSATLTVGALTLVSRLLGLVREVVIARTFGANEITDAWTVAFRIPNFFRRLVGEGAFASAFVPVLSELRAQGDARALKQLVDRVATALFAVLLLLSAVGVLAAEALISIFGYGFKGAQFELAVELLRLTFPYILLISLVAMAGGIYNTMRQFVVPAATPILLNLVMIVAVLLYAQRFEQPIFVLAYGLLCGGLVQLAFQLPGLWRLGLLPRLDFNWRDARLVRIGTLMLPTLAAQSVSQINLIVATALASTLTAGSATWLYNAERLIELPLGVIGVALGTVMLPHLSAQHSTGERAAFDRAFDLAVRAALLLGVPAAIGLWLLADAIIATLFHSTLFDAQDVAMTALALRVMACGLPAYMLLRVLAPAFFARQDTQTPFRIGVVAVAVNVLLAVAGVGYAREIGLEGAHALLSAAAASAGWINVFLLYAALRRAGVAQPEPGWLRFAAALALAATVMALVLGLLAANAEHWINGARPWRIVELVGLVALGAAVYGAVASMTGIDLSRLRERR